MQRNGSFSSVKGKIKKILVAFPNNRDNPHLLRLKGLLTEMPVHTQILVWCNAQGIAKWLQDEIGQMVPCALHCPNEILPSQIRCVLIVPEGEYTHTAYSRWMRDAFVARPSHGEPIELVPTAVPNSPDDGLLVKRYLRQLHFDNGTHFALGRDILPVAGGNLLADDDFVLVGAKQFADYQRQYSDCRGSRDVLGLLGHSTDSRFLPIGQIAEPQSLKHLDLFLTLTGCRDADGRYIVLVAQAVPVGTVPERPSVAVQEYLDMVAHQMEEHGFAVWRNPAPLLQGRVLNPYLGAVNNVLLEVYDQSRAVWLPNITEGKELQPYWQQLCDIQTDNARLWQNLGFDARFVQGNFHDLMDESGALHCMTQELERQTT